MISGSVDECWWGEGTGLDMNTARALVLTTTINGSSDFGEAIAAHRACVLLWKTGEMKVIFLLKGGDLL